jgi:HEAT repeat protein
MRLKSATPALLPLLKSPDAELRAAAAWALGQCAPADTARALAALVTDTHPLVRASAVTALARWPQSDAAPAWRTALADADAAVRSAAIHALRQSGRKDLFPLLLPLLDYRLEKPVEKPGAKEKASLEDIVVWREPANSVRLAAVKTLGEFKVADALPPLIDALERETSFNRLAIIAAIEGQGAGAAKVCLGRIVPVAYDPEAIKNRLPLLINNGTLAVIAGRLGDDRCVPWLLNTLKLPRASLGRDKDLTELFIHSIELLGRYRDGSAAEPLAQLLKESRVRQLSVNTEVALRAIGRPAARPLARHLDAWQTAPLFLRLLREPELRTHAARDAIAKFLSHESDAVRLEATETLGLYLSQGILDEYDTPLLEGQFYDPNREVRASCVRWQAVLAKKSGGEVKR